MPAFDASPAAVGAVAAVGALAGGLAVYLLQSTSGAADAAAQQQAPVDVALKGAALVARQPPPATKVGVAMHLIDPITGKVLVGFRKGGHGAGTCATPGGHQEFSEPHELTACRELEEETGTRGVRTSPMT